MDGDEIQELDLAGYQNTEDLVKGYRASGEEAKRQKARADLLEQQLAQFNRPNVPNRDPRSQLDPYIPIDALDEYVGTRIAQAFEPIARGAMARNDMLSRHSDYDKFEADVAKFVNEDPQLSQSYQRMFASDPLGAMEYAYLKYGEQRRSSEGTKRTPQSQARAEAQIPSSRAGDARQEGTQAQEQEHLNRAWEHFQKTGNPSAYAKARLRGVIRDEFLQR